jgi:hypothetical protein
VKRLDNKLRITVTNKMNNILNNDIDYFEEDSKEWIQNQGPYTLTKIKKNTIWKKYCYHNTFECDLQYVVISTHDNTIFYTSLVHFKQHWREYQRRNCNNLFDGIALRLCNDSHIDPKLELPVIMSIHLERKTVKNYEYIVLWTIHERQKIIDRYFSMYELIPSLFCLILDYSIGPCLVASNNINKTI